MFSNLYVNAAFQGPDNNQDVEAAIANGYRDAAFQGSDNEPARSCASPTGVQG